MAYVPPREYASQHYRTGRQPEPVFELLCESTTGFTRYGTGTTGPTLDTVNKLTGTGAVKISNSSGSPVAAVGLRYTLPYPIDIRQLNFRIKYKVGFDPLPQRLTTGFYLFFYSGSITTDCRSTITIMPCEGWNVLEDSCVRRTDGSNFNPAAVTDITLSLAAYTLPDGGEIILDYFEFYPNGQKAGIIFGFDDGFESEYTKGIVYLDRYKFPSILYMAGERIGTTGFMTAEQIALAKSKNATIATHSNYGMLKFWDKKTETQKTITSISRASNVVTVNCPDHGFSSGDLVYINVGTSNEAALFNGFKVVADASNPDSFTYTQYWADNAGTGLSGTATPYTHDEIDEALHKWCFTQKKYLYDLGYERDCDYMALPAGGRWNTGQPQLRGREDLNILRQYFANVRGTLPYWHGIPGYTYLSFPGSTGPMPRYPRDTWWSWPCSGGAITAANLETFKSNLDKTIAGKAVMVVYVHEIRDTPISDETQTAAWESFVDYVKEKVDAGVLEVLSLDAVTYSAANTAIRGISSSSSGLFGGSGSLFGK